MQFCEDASRFKFAVAGPVVLFLMLVLGGIVLYFRKRLFRTRRERDARAHELADTTLKLGLLETQHEEFVDIFTIRPAVLVLEDLVGEGTFCQVWTDDRLTISSLSWLSWPVCLCLGCLCCLGCLSVSVLALSGCLGCLGCLGFVCVSACLSLSDLLYVTHFSKHLMMV